MALDAQAGCGRHAAHAGADDDDASHGLRLLGAHEP